MELFFPAAGELRQYALKTAPLRRVRFKEGDSIKTHQGDSHVVDHVDEQSGLITYLCGKIKIVESELADTISFSKPEDRLLAGQADELRVFDLRIEAMQRRAAMQQSPVRGFVGGRVDLLPHQMYIANEVSSRLLPRVLLADEVGLGKTIEAGLILHRLHSTGRAGRILILMPEPLIHQWFVEMLRRFSLLFSLYDDERCEAIESNEDNANPFLESQLVLCSIGFLASNPERAEQAAAAGWDLLIVDEAHHLEWTPKKASAQYQLVENLAAKTPGLLLLTATPQQLGPEGHFARLRLLDPDRYDDLDKFLDEAGHYEEVAHAVDRLLELNSCKPEKAASIIDLVHAADDDVEFEAFFIRLLDHLGMHIEEAAARSYFLRPDSLKTDSFPSIPADGTTVTFDRVRALSRENVGFLTWDHPIARGAFDALLGGEDGNATSVVWKESGKEGILLELHYVVECIAPAGLQIERFLPPKVVRIVVDHALTELTEDAEYREAKVKKGDASRLLEKPVMRKKLMPSMLKQGEAFANERNEAIKAAAVGRVEEQLNAEIERLEDLGKINNHVRAEEVEALRQQKKELLTAIDGARVRLDALKLVMRMV